MKKHKHTIGISVVLGLLLWTFYGLATRAQAEKPKPGPQTFKTVMVLLLNAMNEINVGIMTENYKLIEQKGYYIANHPGPPLKEQLKLVRALGPRVNAFKKFDKIVHGSAEKLALAAKQKNMGLVLTHYNTMMKGCVSCHTVVRPLFKAKTKPGK